MTTKSPVHKYVAPPQTITVRVDAERLTVDPEEVHLQSSEQKIRWDTDAPEITVTFDQRPINGALYRRGEKFCEMWSVPSGNSGRHKYTVKLVLEDGSRRRIDPDVVIDY